MVYTTSMIASRIFSMPASDFLDFSLVRLHLENGTPASKPATVLQPSAPSRKSCKIIRCFLPWRLELFLEDRLQLSSVLTSLARFKCIYVGNEERPKEWTRFHTLHLCFNCGPDNQPVSEDREEYTRLYYDTAISNAHKDRHLENEIPGTR